MTHYSDYYFTSELTNFTCPAFGGMQCEPPNACAREPATGKVYCCDFNDGIGNVCWSITSRCADDGSTTTCGSGDQTWCCHYDTEECTGAEGQVNICWNRERSPLGNITNDVLDDTYTSLTSESPSASTFAFDPQSLISPPPTSTPTPTPTSTATTTPATATPQPNSNSNPDSDSSSLSGGAIAGIVVGVVAAVAIILGGAAFILRRRRQRQNPAATLGPVELASELRPKKGQYEIDGSGVYPSKPPQELPASPHQ
ncbi:uncharacterized protein BJX67DRAFT_80057 [Aspergillus lucknowensis]|uniref:Mid2 domain-containing protein n=1 Tax=Aspergillus lucknowensis TaxID=176173 RepID=A0ABR4LSQ3_9EURO